MSINCWELWLFVLRVLLVRCDIRWKCHAVALFDFQEKIIAFKPGESPRLCSERTQGNQMSSVGTPWSTASIKWISYCLLTHRVNVVHSGFTVYHISKWTGYEVHLNLLPFHIPAETIMAHLSSCRGSDMSSNYLAFSVLGVIVSYEIKRDTYWQYGSL